MRRPPLWHSSIASLLLVALAVLAPRTVHAQTDPSGTYRVASDQTTVQVPEWGADCGPRPESRTGAAGRQVTVSTEGTQLVIVDGRRRYRTDACFSDNPRTRRISVSHAGNRWSVVCQTPDADYQNERGTYTITAEATRITYRETTEYSWTMRTSRCRASASRSVNYERTGAAPTPVATVQDAGAPARPTPATPEPTPNRCANPGAAARLEVTPNRRSLAPGGRVCFRARALDSNRCEAASPGAVTWTLARSSGSATAQDAVMENGCVRAPSGSAVAEYAITATAGAFTGRAIAAVVSVEEMRSLVARNLEDIDEGSVPLPTVAPSGTGVGTVSLTPPPAASSAPRSRRTLWILLGVLGAGLAAAVIVLLARRRAGESDAEASANEGFDPSSVSGRMRREAVGIPMSELPIAKGVAPSPRAMAVTELELPAPSSPAAPQEPRPLVKRCPACDRRFTAEMAFCPEDGVSLLAIDGAAPVIVAAPPSAVLPSPSPAAPIAPAPSTAAPALPMVCPACGKRFGATIVFCGEDGTALVRR